MLKIRFSETYFGTGGACSVPSYPKSNPFWKRGLWKKWSECKWLVWCYLQSGAESTDGKACVRHRCQAAAVCHRTFSQLRDALHASIQWTHARCRQSEFFLFTFISAATLIYSVSLKCN